MVDKSREVHTQHKIKRSNTIIFESHYMYIHSILL
jgi:hypothetical protein